MERAPIYRLAACSTLLAFNLVVAETQEIKIFSSLPHPLAPEKITRPWVRKFAPQLTLKSLTLPTCGYATELLRPDERYLFAEQLLDLVFSSAAFIPSTTSKTHITALLDTRTKVAWGAEGVFNQTNPLQMAVGSGITETSLAQGSIFADTWLRQAYASVASKNNFLSIRLAAGYMPYCYGTGVIFGDAYRTINPISPLYNFYFSVDTFRPGVLVEISPNSWAGVELYAGALNKKSLGFAQNAQINRQNLVPNRQPQTMGPNASAYMLLAKAHLESANARTEPLIGFVVDQSSYIEIPNDQETKFGNFGLYHKAQTDWWEYEIELDYQVGSQTAYAIDRNVVKAIGPEVAQDYLFLQTQEDGTFWQASPLQTLPETLSREKKAGEVFTNTEHGVEFTFKNAYSRFRKLYTNKIEAFFGAAQGAIIFEREHDQLVGAGCLLVATGDPAPNDSREKSLINRGNSDQTIYRDFNKYCSLVINTNPLYTNQHLSSLFMFHADKLQRGYTFNPFQLTTPRFTNRLMLGAGVSWYKDHNAWRFTGRGNIFYFRRLQDVERGYSYPVAIKYQQDSNLDLTINTYLQEISEQAQHQLSNNLGVELSGMFSVSHGNLFNLFFVGGMFIPGNSYSTNNAYIPIEFQEQLAQPNQSGLVTSIQTPYLMAKPSVVAIVGLSVSLDFLSNLHTSIN